MHVSCDVTHLQVCLRNIACIGELHEVFSTANDEAHLALLGLCNSGGYKERVSLPKDAARSKCHSGKPILAIGSQHKLLAQNLQRLTIHQA